MNVHYDAPNDELVVDMREPSADGATAALQTDMDADGHILAIRIPSISRLVTKIADPAGTTHSTAFEQSVAEYEAIFGKFGAHLSLEELSERQGVKPVPISELVGKWPGEPDDDFDEFLGQLRASQVISFS